MHDSTMEHGEGPPSSVWQATLAGFCASLVGIGLARFAYTPLLPAIISHQWFAAASATYLGAANLAGYLIGALIASPLAGRIAVYKVLRGMMVLTTASLVACAWPVDFYWFFGWRLLSGIAGGTLMVLAATTILPHVVPSRRGIVSGAIFVGIGLGIAISGTLVPLLLKGGLSEAWLGLATITLVMTAASWSGWPKCAGPVVAVRAGARTAVPSAALRALYLEYGLNAVGLVPHMVFLVDYVARGLHGGLAAGSAYWVAFGIGAIVGPVLAGHLADRVGFRAALRAAFVIEASAVSIAAFGLEGPWLIASSLVVGAFVPGIVTLVLGRTQELLVHHPAAHRQSWTRATATYALFQASAAYGSAWLLITTGGNYRLLFATGAIAMLVALAVDLIASRLFGGVVGSSLRLPRQAQR